MNIILDWLRKTQELQRLGLNWETVITFGAIAVTVLQIIGLSSQIRRLGQKKSAESIAPILFAYQQCLFLSSIVFGIYSGSVAMIISGFSMSVLCAIILYRIALTGETRIMDWLLMSPFISFIPIMLYVPSGWQTTCFVTLNAGSVFALGKQYQELNKSGKVGSVDPVMLTMMTISLGFWTAYAFATRIPALVIITLIQFGMMLAIAGRWWLLSQKKRLLLLDCDLVLVDSFPAIYQGFGAVCDVANQPKPTEEEFCRITRQPFLSVFRDWGIELPEEKIWEIFGRYFTDLDLMIAILGVREWLEALHRRGILLAVISSGDEVSTRRKLKHFGLDDLIDHVVGDCTDKTKAMLDTCRKYGCSPRQAIMVGDMRSDMADAKRAGIYPIGYEVRFDSEEELRAAGAKEVASSHPELVRMVLAHFA